MQTVEANGAQICVDTVGGRSDAPLLLIMGRSSSLDWWEDEFCERLAAGRRFVVRYDHRDTGQSTSYPPGAPGYSGQDMVDDAVAVLDGLGLDRAHIAGMSMGGALAQVLALDHPERVLSLCLIATSPAGPDHDLPAMPDDAAARFAAIKEPDFGDRAAVTEHLVELMRACASQSRPFDEGRERRLVDRVLDRTVSVESAMRNHGVVDAVPRWRERLEELDVPTLVIHGKEDPILPYPHGEALAREIPGARLLPLEHAGHELARADWDVIIDAMLEHTAT